MMGTEADDFEENAEEVKAKPGEPTSRFTSLLVLPQATQPKDLFSLYSLNLAKLGRSPVTIKNYLSNLKLFSRWLKETYEAERTDFTRVKEIDLLSYRNHSRYSKRHKTATINQHVAALRSFFNFLYNNGFISDQIQQRPRGNILSFNFRPVCSANNTGDTM